MPSWKALRNKSIKKLPGSEKTNNLKFVFSPQDGYVLWSENKSIAMLSISEAKQIIGSDADELNDQKITEILGVIQGFASIAMDKWIKKLKEEAAQTKD